MKTALAVIATALQALASCNAYAHGDHRPKHGGIMGRGDDEISVELVMEKGTAILYVEDESGTPLPTEKVKGTLSLAAPGRPTQEGKLVPAGGNKLPAEGPPPPPRGPGPGGGPPPAPVCRPAHRRSAPSLLSLNT